MFEKRSCETELIDDLALAGPALTQNLRELEGVNRWLGGKRTLISALNRVYRKHRGSLEGRRVTIADLGCGGGDLLAAIHDWANERGLDAELVGIDANPVVIEYAVRRSRGFRNMRFETIDVLSPELDRFRFDIVCLNTFCHHLSDANLARLMRRLDDRTSTAIIVNDLHRHWLAYASIRVLSRALDLSHLARHDGPVSVLRAFRRHELMDVLERSNIEGYDIRWRWPFRWELIVWTG